MVTGTLYSCDVTLGEVMLPVYVAAGSVCACLMHRHANFYLPIPSQCLLSRLVVLFSRSVVSNSFATPWTVARQASFVHGILQARVLEWVAIPFSRGSSLPRDQTHVSCIDR